METKWHVVYTEPKCEKKVEEILGSKKFEHYCPLKKNFPHLNEKKKHIPEPLFTSYVFVKAGKQDHSEIRKINGIINFVYWLNEPVTIPDQEINAIKNCLIDYPNVQLKKTDVHINATVKIISDDIVKIITGPLTEYKGRATSVKMETVRIILPSLGYILIGETENIVIKQRSFNEVNSERLNVRV
jgi:transcription antitermination factor NusG